MLKRATIAVLGAGMVFVFGFAVGYYRIFPFPQIVAVKDRIERYLGSAESGKQILSSGSVEVVETFLQRLLIKKIKVPGFDTRGGGCAVAEDILYIVTNKGHVNAVSLGDFNPIHCDISKAPLNFEALVKSGHPYKNGFKIHWFRVNGVYVEIIDPETHLLFVSHNAYDPAEDLITHNISRVHLKINEDSVIQTGDWETIFTALPGIEPVPKRIFAVVPYPGHISGGAMIGYDEERLLVAVGDYNRQGIDNTTEWSMDNSNPYGKLILLNKTTGDWSIFTSGHRNPSGLYRDQDSIIWSVELGPIGGDELNVIVEGKNYGWPRVSHGLWYDLEYDLPGNRKPGTHKEYTEPVFAWVPSIAPRGLTKIESQKFDAWNGDLIVGTMEDQSLHRLRLDSKNNVINNERIPLGHRVRDLTTLPDGTIAIMTDDEFLILLDDGGISSREMDLQAMQRIVQMDQYARHTADFIETEASFFKDPTRAVFERHCSTCHNINLQNQIGPHLAGLMARQIGKAEGYRYSKDLKEETRKWTADLLKLFLKNPRGVFPATTMPKPNLSSEDLDSIIQFLNNLSENS